jgi:glycosyltransferase involved in cell wall biosynthesis
VEATSPPAPPAAPAFTVVVPVHNSRSYLPQFVEALERLEEPPGGYEVVFVDNRSTDGGEEYLREVAGRTAGFRVVEGPGIGPAAARNRGIAAARGSFVAFTDPDTLPEADWLVEAARALEAQAAMALEGAVVPESPNGSGRHVRRVVNRDGGRYMTANMVYARSLLEEVGGFDERFRPPPFLEDNDLAFRVLDRGAEIPFAPQARVRHRDMPMSARRELADQGRLQWMALLARKHPRRYRTDLRPKVQTFRPGDVDLLLAAPLFVATLRAGPAARLLAGAWLALGVRRVLASAELDKVPADRRVGWMAVSLLLPAARAFHLARGWLRFRTLAL